MTPAKPKKLYYRVSHNGGIVFATPEDAKKTDQIFRAILNSKTWGEFRKALPEGEYDYLAEDWEPEDIPADDDEFSSGSVPGYDEGGYPLWLQPEMEYVLPKEILEAYGKNEMTMLDGNYFHIDPIVETELVEKLVQLGFDVEKREDLEFW